MTRNLCAFRLEWDNKPVKVEQTWSVHFVLRIFTIGNTNTQCSVNMKWYLWLFSCILKNIIYYYFHSQHYLYWSENPWLYPPQAILQSSFHIKMSEWNQNSIWFVQHAWTTSCCQFCINIFSLLVLDHLVCVKNKNAKFM